MKNKKKIGTFTATNKSPNAYKTDKSFYRQLYKKNKALLSEKGLTEEKFISRLENIRAEGFTRTEAARAYSRTRLFLSKEQVGLENIKENLRKAEALEVRKASGHYRKGIDWDEYTWNEEKGGYMHESGTHWLTWNYGTNSTEETWIGIEYAK